MTGPILGLTMGDPAGVGPEIALKALRDLAPREAAGELSLVVIGTASCMADAAERLGMPAKISADGGGWPNVRLIEAATTEGTIAPGRLSAEAGRLAFAAIERAVQLALAGDIDAIVTAPINKEALNKAGHAYPGHTEILADLTGSKGSCMMLAHERLGSRMCRPMWRWRTCPSG